MKLQRLLSSFTNLDHVANVSELIQRENLLHGQILENRVIQNIYCKDPRKMMLVWNTGDSYGLTPFRSDFIDDVKCYITVKYVTKLNRVIGIGTNLHKFIKITGQDIFLTVISYHGTQKYVRFFYPHTYYKMNCSHSTVKGNRLTMHLRFHRIHIPVDLGGTNLTVIQKVVNRYPYILAIGLLNTSKA